ncbi:cationic amino acid transporter, partial [Elysia marginata]
EFDAISWRMMEIILKAFSSSHANRMKITIVAWITISHYSAIMLSPSSSWVNYVWHRMWLKHEAHHKDLRTDLIRCLSTWQLTLLGLGNTIGVGIYVLLGVMVKEEAGPSAIFSFLIAIIVTWMNAMVFAEFSTYIPQTGAAYIFLYKDHTVAVLGKIELGPPFAEKIDFVAFVFQIVIMIVVSFNILCTSVVNTVLGVLTSSVLIFVFIVGVIHGNSDNFFNSEHGGFFPFGAVGVVKAASMALYAMSGFEIVPMSSEESKNPAKSVPRAVVAEVVIVGMIYIGAAIGMMFLIPYWMVDLRAPLPSALEYSGLEWGKMIVTVGPMFGITNLQMLSLYSVSRAIYRMSKDGLIFSFFLTVDDRTGAPRRAVLFSGVFMSVFALLFDLSYVVKMSLVLMLTSYIAVAAALIRLKVDESNISKPSVPTHSIGEVDEDFSLFTEAEEETLFSRETKNRTGSISSDTFDENKTTNNNELLINTSVLFENTAEYIDQPEILTDVESKSEKLYNNHFSSQSVPEESMDQEHLIELNLPSAQLDKVPVKNSTLLDSPQNVTVPAETGALAHESNGKSHSLTIASGVAAPSQFPDVPTNLLIGLHVVTCVTLSGQMIYGVEDLQALRPVAVLACTMLAVLLLVFSVLLWFVCSRNNSAANQSRDPGFQTPLMPLVPTCSMVLSSLMLFSAADTIGFVEVLIMVVFASLGYFLMTVAEYKSDFNGGFKGTALLEAQEQEMRLITPDGRVEENFDDDDDYTE